MSELLDRLRDRGYRLTSQRRVIAEVLAGDHVHLTAEQVHGEARARLPEISLATVYNTLGELVALGELLEVAPDDGPKRYDPNVGIDHQHLVCVGCGRVLDVHPSRLPELPAHERHGFELVDVNITFRGRCPDCITH